MNKKAMHFTVLEVVDDIVKQLVRKTGTSCVIFCHFDRFIFWRVSSGPSYKGAASVQHMVQQFWGHMEKAKNVNKYSPLQPTFNDMANLIYVLF